MTKTRTGSSAKSKDKYLRNKSEVLVAQVQAPLIQTKNYKAEATKRHRSRATW